MMTYKKLLEGLDSLGLPVAYNHFNINVTLPFLIINEDAPDIFKADDGVYHEVEYYTVRYYFEQKNKDEEDKIKRKLQELGLTYNLTGDIYIENEKMFYKEFEVNF